jgi:hypothetical protein
MLHAPDGRTVIAVKIERIDLTCRGKIGYNAFMFVRAMSFVMRMLMVAAIWVFVWRLVEAKTRAMRILRAALLLICLLGVLAVLKTTRQ